jgi:hypothetical protein
MALVKRLYFCTWLGANQSNSNAIAQICNNAMDEKTPFYVACSVQNSTVSLLQLKT